MNSKKALISKGIIEAILNLRVEMKRFLEEEIKKNELNITFEMLQVLGVLWRKGDINQQEIAEKVQKNKASLTSLLDNLHKRNLIVRNEDPQDRRNKIISLTNLGKDYETQIQPLLKNFYYRLQNNFSKEEIDTINVLLEKMRSNLM